VVPGLHSARSSLPSWLTSATATHEVVNPAPYGNAAVITSRPDVKDHKEDVALSCVVPTRAQSASED
jgi:hypothetical protein